jgi:hypothetical protein
MARVDDAVGDADEGTAFTVLVASGDRGGMAVELSVLVELPADGVGAGRAFFIAFFFAVELCVVGVAAPLGDSVCDGLPFGGDDDAGAEA